MKKASEILARILEEKNRKIGETYSSIFGAWSRIVGDSLAEHSRIYEITNRNLCVEVDHPGWMQLLLIKKPHILRAVKHHYPALDIQGLRIKVNLSYPDAVSEDSANKPVYQEGEGAAPEDRRDEVDRIVSTVSQDELKQRLRRLFLRSLERENSGRG